MKTKRLRLSNLVFFKRWQNKPYSVFNTLGKVVIVLCLPLVYVAMSFQYSFSQQDTVVLSNITINSQRISTINNQTAKLINVISSEQIKALPANSLTDILDGSLGVDFQKRGAAGVQADLSIRGSNFDQQLILINGIPINDQQTGHNAFNIHFPVELIERIEVVQGAATHIFGNGAYAGAINIVTKNKQIKSLSVGYGQFNTANFSAVLSSKQLIFATNWQHSDGYKQNTDFDIANLFFRYNFKQNSTNSFIQLVANTNNFGAFNFYTPKFPYQYERVAKLFFNIQYTFAKSQNHKINFYSNFGYDNFQLFRQSKDWWQLQNGYFVRNSNDTAKLTPTYYYKNHNYHFTSNIGLSYNFSFNSIAGTTYLGINAQMDTIISNVLGNKRDTIKFGNEIFFNKGDLRFISNIFVNHTKKIRKFTIAAGANMVYNSVFKTNITYNAQILYNFNTKIKFYAAFSQGVRFPTFTDLYYQGPSNQGNPNLKPETASNYELGTKFFASNISFQANTFFIDGRNTIDWVKVTKDEPKWKTMNYTRLISKGFQISVSCQTQINWLKNINFDYTYIHQDKPQTDWLSKYSLNYLRHNLSITTFHNIFKNFNLVVRARYFLRNGNYSYYDNNNQPQQANYKPLWLVSTSASYKIGLFEIYINAQNILNKKYYDLSYIELPGLWIVGGIRYTF